MSNEGVFLLYPPLGFSNKLNKSISKEIIYRGTSKYIKLKIEISPQFLFFQSVLIL